ncbi:conserved oligomeric Golgi complex subunit 7-like [Asterias amurensis]|uniref:conserved oligomeric Golgi complex subunit 7-like n=1 Tax=Asterias amurensis TaxID=7602 RepID=UPI003AB1C411
MDFSKFLDANFDAVEWVNAAFTAQKDAPDQKDAHAATLVMKLQLFIQEVNHSLEETSQQAVQNIPRVLREVESVKQEATFLKEQMQLVKEDIKKVEEDTSQSMKMLLDLDAIKSRMKAASDALQEADNWTTLMADVDEVFQSKNTQAIADKLMAMQHSLSMLAHCGDYEERCQHLETLKNRLEAMLSPQLVSAFNTHSLESAQTYVKIFLDIDRLPQLYNYYYKCHKSSLLQQWQTLQGDNLDKPLAEWLPTFYDTLLSTWHKEIQWCEQVFPEAVRVVSELLTQTLSGLQPSLPACMDTALQDNTLPNLLELRQIVMRFIKNLESAILETAGSISGSHFYDLVNAIHAPYVPYLLQYGRLEREFMLQEVSCTQMEKRDLIDCAQLLSNSTSKVFKIAHEAVDRCVGLTDGCGCVGLLEALKAMFQSYCQKFHSALGTLHAAGGLDSIAPSHAELGEDWSKFQHALKIIQTCGELFLQSEEFEMELIGSVLNTATSHVAEAFSPTKITNINITPVSDNPFKEYNYLVKEDPVQHAVFVDLILKLKQDKVSLLKEVMDGMQKVNEHAHKFTFSIVFHQLEAQLSQISSMEVWTTEGGMLAADLPTFSLSPQEYITKIGQYLMTLPQQLEPFTSQENPSLEKALETGKLPYPPEAGSATAEHLADYWLGAIARGTMHTYVEAILKITELTPNATRQLATDIDYLCNVLDALGIHASESLRNIETLLKLPLSQYGETRGTIPDRFVHIIGSIRSVHET